MCNRNCNGGTQYTRQCPTECERLLSREGTTRAAEGSDRFDRNGGRDRERTCGICRRIADSRERRRSRRR